jgi:hypothetical protein
MAKISLRTSATPSTPSQGLPPVQTPTAAVTTTPDTPAEPTARAPRSYRHRRLGLTMLSFAALGFWLYHANVPTTPLSSTSALDQQATVTAPVIASPMATIKSVLTQATSYKTTHGSFTGFAPVEPSGVRIAAAGPGMIVSVQSGTTCLYSGVLSSGVRPVLSDTTGQACTASLVAQAQATLSAQSTATAKDVRATLAATAKQVESSLLTWSLVSSGTFNQVPASLGIPGAEVVSRSTRAVTIKISVDGSCEVLTASPSSPQTPTTSSC